MASTLTINTSVFKDRADAYIGKMRSTSIIAMQQAQELILQHALLTAPSPRDEEKAILSWLPSAPVFNKEPDAADDSGERIRFMKQAGQFFIHEVLTEPQFRGLIFEPSDTETKVGFKLGNLNKLDELTRFSWVNASVKKGEIQTYGPFTSKHGSFFAFEYGFSFDIRPVNAKLLHPEAGVHVEYARKTVPAHGMFTSIIPEFILEEIGEKLREVQFIEE